MTQPSEPASGQPSPGQPPAQPPYQSWPPPNPQQQYPPQYPAPYPSPYPVQYPVQYPPPAQQWSGYPPVVYAPVPPRPPFPHPEPRQYHEMLRTWTYAWWRPTVGILLLLAGMVIVLPLLLFPLLIVGVLVEGTNGDFATALTNAAEFSTPSAAGLLYLNLTLAATVLWTWGLIRVLHQMRPRWLSSVVPKLRWRFLLICALLAAVAVGASIAVGYFLPSSGSSGGGGDEVSTGRSVALALVVLLTTPLQAAGEEYAFRGYLLMAVGALTRNKWVTIVITAALFATAHLQFAPPLFLDRFLFGLVAGWLVIRTGGLESGIALHVLNNFLALGLAILSGDLVTALNSPSADWWALIPSLTQSVVFAALVTWVARRMNLQTRTRPPVPEEPSAALVSA